LRHSAGFTPDFPHRNSRESREPWLLLFCTPSNPSARRFRRKACYHCTVPLHLQREEKPMSRAVTIIAVVAAFGVLAYAGSSQQAKTNPLQVSVVNSPTVKVSNASTPLAVKVVDNKTFHRYWGDAQFATNSEGASFDIAIP